MSAFRWFVGTFFRGWTAARLRRGEFIKATVVWLCVCALFLMPAYIVSLNCNNCNHWGSSLSVLVSLGGFFILLWLLFGANVLFKRGRDGNVPFLSLVSLIVLFILFQNAGFQQLAIGFAAVVLIHFLLPNGRNSES